MAEVNLYNSPIHSDSSLTAIFGQSGSLWSCGFHTGIDFVPYGTTGTNPEIYPCFPRNSKANFNNWCLRKYGMY